MSHATLAPSSAHVWAPKDGCRAAPVMRSKYPNPQTDAAADGTAAHELAEGFYKHAGLYPDALDKLDFAIASAKAHVTEPERVTDEMIEAALIYVRDLMEVARWHATIENKITISDVHESCFGTPDAYYFDGATLYIWDFKYGHRPVEVYQNWQLILYYSGIISRHKIDGYGEQQLTVVFRIVQPRAYNNCGPIQEWRTPATDLRGYINIAAEAAKEAIDSVDPVARSGPHCRFCPARHDCEVALKGGLGLYESAGYPASLDMTNDQLSTQLSIIQRAKEQLDALETGYLAAIESKIRGGEIVAGYSLRPKQGPLKWKGTDEEVVRLADMLGLQLTKQTLLTPKQAITAGVPEETIKQLSHYPNAGVKLDRDKPQQIKRFFS